MRRGEKQVVKNKKIWSVCLFFAVVAGGCGSDDSTTQAQNETVAQQPDQQSVAKQRAQQQAKEIAGRVKLAKQKISRQSAPGGGSSLRSDSQKDRQQKKIKKQIKDDWRKLQDRADQWGTGRSNRSEKQLEDLLGASEDLAMVAQLIKEIADVGLNIVVTNPIGIVYETADLLSFLRYEFYDYLKGDNIFKRTYESMREMFSNKEDAPTRDR
ncbi:MAG: hypothetical protein AAF310_00965 [Myxococcota bacterium]